jgi:addiction module RelE/StbE family toxin
MKVIIREAAYADLERIFHWIERDSPRNAASVADRILDSIEQTLAFFPKAGHRGKAAGTYEWVVRGLPYIVVYRLDEARDELTVVAVLHGAQDR